MFSWPSWPKGFSWWSGALLRELWCCGFSCSFPSLALWVLFSLHPIGFPPWSQNTLSGLSPVPKKERKNITPFSRDQSSRLNKKTSWFSNLHQFLWKPMPWSIWAFTSTFCGHIESFTAQRFFLLCHLGFDKDMWLWNGGFIHFPLFPFEIQQPHVFVKESRKWGY